MYNSITPLMLGSIGSSAISSYASNNPMLMMIGTTIGTTVGSYTLIKIADEIKKQKNMYSIVNNVEECFSNVGKQLGFVHYSLKIDEYSIVYFKYLSYLINKYKDELITNNFDYSLTNHIKLSDLNFNVSLRDEYIVDNTKHLIIVSFERTEQCEHIVLRSKTADTFQLNKYIKKSIIQNTTKTHIILYQPEFTRLQDTTSKNEKTKTQKTIIHWKCFYVYTNKNLQNTIVSDHVNNEFISDLQHFIDNEEHYNKKGIPYKRGYLLYGPPGTGKTSLIKSIASTYGMDVYLINMGEVQTSDDITKLFNGFRNTGNYHIVCFEDVDKCKMFSRASSRWDRDDDGLRTLLNELDGLNEGNKRITIFTANDVEIVQNINALCRPGRIDKNIMINYCDSNQVCKLFNHYTTQQQQLEEITLTKDITPACVLKLLLTNSTMSPDQFKTKLNNGSTENKEHSNNSSGTSNNGTAKKTRKTTNKRKTVNHKLSTLYNRYSKLTKQIDVAQKNMKKRCESFSKSLEKQSAPKKQRTK